MLLVRMCRDYPRLLIKRLFKELERLRECHIVGVLQGKQDRL